MQQMVMVTEVMTFILSFHVWLDLKKKNNNLKVLLDIGSND